MAVRSEETRFKRWQARVSPKTRLMSECLLRTAGPLLLEAGFRRVDRDALHAKAPVKPNQLRFERWVDGAVDAVDFLFEKYERPAQYSVFWGKPRVLPLLLWSDADSAKAVATVAELLPQVIHMLDSGVRGPNISRETRHRPLRA